MASDSTPTQISQTAVRPARRGFTLVEMLAVIGVIAVLMSIIVPTLSGVRREAESVSCQSNLRQLHGAIEIYRASIRGMLPMCDFLPASTPEGPVGGLVEVLGNTVERDCKCWYCPADLDEEGSLAAGTSYVYLPGLLRYSPQVQIQVATMMAASMNNPGLNARMRERQRRDAEAKLVGALYDQTPRAFAILADSQDRHKIGSRVPRNAVYIDGSVGILREPDEDPGSGG
ncbi:MAG: type II secretion system protein [Planctomycetota bacterium]|jgi:prepilin-type N-terminal cleavage/methylation domain-containing protein|nr:type II secretion system protein [Planctomycetota bacterium]